MPTEPSTINPFAGFAPIPPYAAVEPIPTPFVEPSKVSTLVLPETRWRYRLEDPSIPYSLPPVDRTHAPNALNI